MKRPLALLGFSLFTTQFLLCQLSTNTAVVILSTLAIISAVLLFVFIAIKKIRQKALPILCISLSAFLATAMFCSAEKQLSDSSSFIIGEDKKIEASVLSIPTSGKQQRYYSILRLKSVDSIPCDAKMRLLSYEMPNFSVGDNIEFTAIKTYALGDSISFLSNNKAKGICFGGYATKFNVVSSEKNAFSISLLGEKIASRLSSYMLRNLAVDEAAIINSVIINDRSELSSRLQNLLSYSGVNHLLVVSGFHLSVWSYCLYMALKKLKAPPAANIIVSLFVLILFCSATGFSPSAIRAAIMLSIVYISELLIEKADGLNSLGLALICFCLYSPYSGGSISLVLSAFATTGIIIFSPYLSAILSRPFSLINSHKIERIFKAISALISVSLAANIACIPFLFLYFGTFSLLAIPASFILMYPTQGAMIIGSLAFLLSPLPFLSKPLLLLAGACAKIVLLVLEGFSHIDAMLVKADMLIVVSFVLMLIVLTLCLLLKSEKFKLKNLITVFAVLLFFFCSIRSCLVGYFSLNIYVPSTGYNTVNVLTHRGKTIMIGCGGSSSYHIENTMKRAANASLDILLLTGFKDFEAKQLEFVINTYRPGTVIVPACYADLIEDSPFLSKQKLILADEDDSIAINNSLRLDLKLSEELKALRLCYDKHKILFTFMPGDNFSDYGSDWISADTLIARADMPKGLYYNDFGRIIFSTDKENLTGYKILNTKIDGDIFIEIR